MVKGNLSVTTRRVITENAPFANRSESDSEILRTFEITSCDKICLNQEKSSRISDFMDFFLRQVDIYDSGVILKMRPLRRISTEL